MRILRGVLGPEQAAGARRSLEGARWIDGRATAGHQSARVKDNAQVAEDDPIALRLGDVVLEALAGHAGFVSAALPLKVHPPLFNRYSGGQSFGTHVDNAIRQVRGTPHRVRTDLSITLFLSEPDAYDGGELVVSGPLGERVVKLPAGDAVLYEGSSLHHVRPVTRGERVASFSWIQSMVRDAGERSVLLGLDEAIRRLAAEAPDSPCCVELVGIYHQLLRRWADA
jgi:PKHD-type hydroxylase